MRGKSDKDDVLKTLLSDFISSSENSTEQNRWYMERCDSHIIIKYKALDIFDIDTKKKRICIITDEGVMRIKKYIMEISNVLPDYLWYGDYYMYHMQYAEMYGTYDRARNHITRKKKSKKSKKEDEYYTIETEDTGQLVFVFKSKSEFSSL